MRSRLYLYSILIVVVLLVSVCHHLQILTINIERKTMAVGKVTHTRTEKETEEKILWDRHSKLKVLYRKVRNAGTSLGR